MPTRRPGVTLPPAVPVALSAVALAAALTACGSSSGSAGAAGSGVTINATDTVCELSATTMQPGTTSFSVTNKGSKVTEVYVYGKSGDAFTRVVSEVEDIGPGLTREMDAELEAGTYEVACKPGQTGDGIRTTITVGTADQAAGASATSSASAAERQIALTTDDKTIGGLDQASGTVGETIEFELANGTTGTRVLEVKRPDGSVAGEVEIAAGAEGKLEVPLTVAGSWKVIVEGSDPELEQPFPVS